MRKKYVIGLSGLAKSGKDLFYKILSRQIKIKRHALADELKFALRERILKEDDIDILDCSSDQKDIVRPKLVEYAKKVRFSSKGRHWIETLNNKILPVSESICVTDVRYDDYENDEVHWLKNELNGILVHISKYEILNNNKKLFFEAPNEEERRNNPKLRDKADYIVEWPISSKQDPEEMEKELEPYVSEFVGWLRKRR